MTIFSLSLAIIRLLNFYHFSWNRHCGLFVILISIAFITNEVKHLILCTTGFSLLMCCSVYSDLCTWVRLSCDFLLLSFSGFHIKESNSLFFNIIKWFELMFLENWLERPVELLGPDITSCGPFNYGSISLICWDFLFIFTFLNCKMQLLGKYLNHKGRV